MTFVLAIGWLKSSLAAPSGGMPDKLLLPLGSPPRQPVQHLRVWAALARRLSQPARRERLLVTSSAAEFVQELLASS